MNNKGFMLAWFSILLITLLGAFASTSSLLIIQWNKQKSTELCRQELKDIQTFAAGQARRLFSLNPQAIGLRTELTIVESQIVAALAAGQLPLVKALKIKRTVIRAKQKQLELTQKLIIKNTHVQIKAKILLLRQNLNSLLMENQKNIGTWGENNYLIGPIPQSRFAFKPTDQRLAPPYEPYKNFEKNQSMAMSWVEKYKWNRIQTAFSFPTQIRSQCRLSLKEESWKPIIQKDRL